MTMGSEEQIEKLDSKVRAVLDEHPETRNSDITLTIKIWREYYDVHGAFLAIDRLYELPSVDDVKRIRAKIQNEEKLYPPTDWKIAKKRHWLEDEWKRAMGYNTVRPEDSGQMTLL